MNRPQNPGTVPCSNGDLNPARYDLSFHRDGRLTKVLRNLCRGCAHREGDRGIVDHDEVAAILIAAKG